MKFLEEYRRPDLARRISAQINDITKSPHTIMEVCGGQTNAIVKYGIDKILPSQITLIHGPGCPVCVTPLEKIEQSFQLALKPNVIFCSFGDMLRVPGLFEDLFFVKSKGGDVRIVYSPLDALKIAKENPSKEIVFFAVGFETTAPGNAQTVILAKENNIQNFSLLVSHVLVPPAMEAVLSSEKNRIQGFLAAGHVCSVMGYNEYIPIAQKYHVPIVVTGFEPIDILQGIYMCVKQLESEEATVTNQYARVVRKGGNPKAMEVINEVFHVVDRKWRGLGVISQSGLALKNKYSTYDAEIKFSLSDIKVNEPTECQSGSVLQGFIKPSECAAFGKTCTPEHPLGATMVSAEGACAAYYRYRRKN